MSVRKQSEVMQRLKQRLGLLTSRIESTSVRTLRFETMEPRIVMDGLPLISEFVADNKNGLLDEDADASDWIEILNPTDHPINLQGWYLTDDADELPKWQFPSTTIDAGAYLVVFASDKDRNIATEELHTNFKLSSDGEYLALVQPDGVTIASEFADEFPSQREDVSYGVSQLVQTFPLVSSLALASVFVPDETSDAAITNQWTGANPSFDDSATAGWSRVTLGAGFIEESRSETTVAYETLPGVGTRDAFANLGMDFEVIEPILVTELGVYDSGQDGIAGTLGVSLWLRDGSDATMITSQNFIGDDGTIAPGTGSRFIPLDESLLLQPGGYTIVASGFYGDDLLVESFVEDSIQGTVNSGGGAIEFQSPARYSSGALSLEEQAHHRFPSTTTPGPINKYAAGTFKFKTAVKELIQTDIGPLMSDQNASVYLRTAFDVSDPTLFETMQMSINYDDGFVAYLNGVEVARRNAPTNLQFDSTATTERDSSEVLAAETIDLSEFIHLLQPNSSNILAFHGLNAAADNEDFVITATLEASRLVGSELGYFAEPTPGEPNSTVTLGFVDDVQFSVERGFIAAEDLNAAGQLTVEISTDTAGAHIFFTTDGTPPTATSGSLYLGPITLSTTATLRAIAVKEGFFDSAIGTQSYIFLDEVLNQSGVPNGYSTHWNGAAVDYDISQNGDDLPLIAGNANATEEEYRQAIKDSLLSLPTLSIAIDPEQLFGLTEGIYTNPFPRGRDSERAASVEYILPDGSDGFQIDAGLRMMGWTSRVPSTSPKHSLRLVFRDDYGPSRLEYPFFDGLGIDSFDTIALRSNGRDSWTSDDNAPGARSVVSYVRDQWAKTVQADLGQPATTGNFVHLYLNGIYWGVYNPTERPDAAFAEEHFGGDEDDYDVVSFCNPTERSVHGDLDIWNELHAWIRDDIESDEIYQRIQGNNPDGTRNPEYPVLIDMENFIDYIVAGQFDAASDWPCNYYAIRERGENSEGFKFITWDNDLGLPKGDVNANRVNIKLPGLLLNSPWVIEKGLRKNDEYLVQFADSAQEYLFNGGQLTPEVNIQRWQDVAAMVTPGLIAESARWGDYRRDVQTSGPAELYTIDHWNDFNDHMLSTYFPQRSAVYVEQLRTAELFPSIDAPSFSQHGGEVNSGFQLEITATAGDLWYTLDGSDPRLSGGEVNPLATLYTGQIQIDSNTKVRARALSNGQWSALNEAAFETNLLSSQIRVSELMFNPDGNDDSEFIEITNIGEEDIDLTGVRFVLDDNSDGFEYEFLATDSNLILPAGGHMIIARDRAGFLAEYPEVPLTAIADRQYAGALSNEGETLTLVNDIGETIQQFTYDDHWYLETDGDGHSLVIADTTANLDTWNTAAAWQASQRLGGSPGQGEIIGQGSQTGQYYGLQELLDIKLNLDQSSQTIPHLDFNADGIITTTDLRLLLSYYGTSIEGPISSNSSASPATEPAHAASSLFVTVPQNLFKIDPVEFETQIETPVSYVATQRSETRTTNGVNTVETLIDTAMSEINENSSFVLIARRISRASRHRTTNRHSSGNDSSVPLS